MTFLLLYNMEVATFCLALQQAFTMKFYRSDLYTVINSVWVRRPQCMDLFFVPPEGIQI